MPFETINTEFIRVDDSEDSIVELLEWFRKLSQQIENNEKEPPVRFLLMNKSTLEILFPALDKRSFAEELGLCMTKVGNIEIKISNILPDGKIIPLDKEGQIINKDWRPKVHRILSYMPTHWPYTHSIKDDFETIQKYFYEPPPIISPEFSYDIGDGKADPEVQINASIFFLKIELRNALTKLQCKYETEFNELRQRINNARADFLINNIE